MRIYIFIQAVNRQERIKNKVSPKKISSNIFYRYILLLEKSTGKTFEYRESGMTS
jgi:hypothetical protein